MYAYDSKTKLKNCYSQNTNYKIKNEMKKYYGNYSSLLILSDMFQYSII